MSLDTATLAYLSAALGLGFILRLVIWGYAGVFAFINGLVRDIGK